MWKGQTGPIAVDFTVVGFFVGKIRKVQRFLYNLSPRGTGDKGKEDRNGTDAKNVESYGHRG